MTPAAPIRAVDCHVIGPVGDVIALADDLIGHIVRILTSPSSNPRRTRAVVAGSLTRVQLTLFTGVAT